MQHSSDMAFRAYLDPRPADLAPLRVRLQSFLLEQGLPSGCVDALMLCVQEACTNAIVHSGTSKPIELNLKREADRVTVRIRDHGRGLRLDEGPNALAMPEPMTTHGRGLPLMRHLMDILRFENCANGGLAVTLTKEVPGASPRLMPACRTRA